MKFLSALLVLLAMACLLGAWNILDPHLFPFRFFDYIALSIVCTVTGLIAWFAGRGKMKTFILAVVALAFLVASFLECQFQYQKYVVLHAPPELQRVIGKHIVAGFVDSTEIEELVEKGLVSGVFITRRNIKGFSAEQISQLIGHLQAIRQKAGFPFLLITTDQEGGMISRLSPPLKKQPSLAEVVKGKSSTEAEKLARKYGEEQGKALASVGVNVNFSPVVDLKIRHAHNPADIHSHISQRAISDDPQRVALVADAYVKGLKVQGINATLKHFPGLGRVLEDTHHFSAKLSLSKSSLETSDWVPFRYILNDTSAFMMLGHVILSKIDPENPVSFSHKVVNDIIRHEWGFKGILITDDLTMAAAYHHGLCEVGMKALNAGVDLLLVSYDIDKVYPVIYCAMQAYKDGNLDKGQMQGSHERINRLFD